MHVGPFRNILLPSSSSSGAYKASMVQAFQRTVKEARFAMVIVDAPNLSLDDLKVYWAAGQVSQHSLVTA